MSIYRTLFVVETVIRELIIEVLAGIAGPLWWKTRLPPDALQQFKEHLAKDRETQWTSNLPYHPIYYVGFPDLRATIEQKTNWNGAFRQIFPKTRELLTTDLIELEFIRNKVAHNRQAASTDVEIVEAAFIKLQAAIGAVRFDALAQRRTYEPHIAKHLSDLRRESDVSYALSVRGRRIGKLPVWKQAQESWWWLDSDYLGCPYGRVPQYYGAVEALEQARAGANPAGTDEKLAIYYKSARTELLDLAERWEPR